MIVKEDFYSGEPVITGSPPSFSSDMIIGQGTTPEEIDAAGMASFGKYDYDPGMRTVVSSPVSIYPGQDGYNMYPQGIGANPYGQYSQYGNLQPTYGQFRTGAPNPVLQPGYYPGGYGGSFYGSPYYQNPYQQRPTTYDIPGISPFGEYLPPADYEQRITEIQMEYYNKQQEVEAKSEVDRASQQSYYGGYYGYNYYGVPFYNTYQYNGINSELVQEVEKLKEEARENRMQFNLNMSRLAHNFNHDDISDDSLEQRYRGKTVNIPQAIIPSYQFYYEQSRLENMVPFDNSQVYRDYHAAVSREFNEIIPKDSNLKETFDNMGIVAAQWEMEEEQHRRRDQSTLYNSSNNAYKHFVRQKAKERYCKEKGISMLPNGEAVNLQQMRQGVLSSTPVLSQNATLADDGTLNVSLTIPYNVGSHIGETYSVNAQEKEYAEKRERFGRFLDSIQGSIYLDNQKHKKLEEYNDG